MLYWIPICLPFDCFSCFHALAYKPLDGLTSNLVDELIIGLHQIQVTFGPITLSSHHFLTSEWSRSFWISILLFKFTVPNKTLKRGDIVARIAEHYLIRDSEITASCVMYPSKLKRDSLGTCLFFQNFRCIKASRVGPIPSVLGPITIMACGPQGPMKK